MITASKFAWLHTPSASPYSVDHGLQVHLQTHSITPQSVSLNSLDYDLQVHLRTYLNTASKCISKLTRLQPPSSHDHGLQVNIQIALITASKQIFEDGLRIYGDTEVTEVDGVTGSVYSADSRVDRHHLMSISSYHTTKIHTQSFPTFDFNRSVWDLVDPCNCADPQRRVVSYLLTNFLCSLN